MQWHRLPPRNPAECPFRVQVEHQPAGESATCGLVRSALPLADERFWRVPHEACAACCRMDPAAATSWNTVVASLVYRAASAVAADPAAPVEAVALAADVRPQAELRLELAGAGPDAESRPVGQFGPTK